MKRVVLAFSIFSLGLSFGQGAQPSQPQGGSGLIQAQKAAVKASGQPYFERGYARVMNVQRNAAVAHLELACGDMIPGDIAIPFVEREKPVYRNVKLDRFAPANGKTIGRIILANEF